MNVFIDKFVFLIGKTRDKRDSIYMHVCARTQFVCMEISQPLQTHELANSWKVGLVEGWTGVCRRVRPGGRKRERDWSP